MIRRVLPAALALALVACGGNEESAPEAASDAAPATPAATEPAAATPDASVAAAPAAASPLDAAIAGDWRAADAKARDAFRHPKETLEFFGITPDMTVIEITPGGGWYTDILAPYLRDGGMLIGAIVDPVAIESEGGRKYYTDSNQKLRDKLAAAPAQFDKVTLVEFDPKAPKLGESGSADAVLTFRNVHNWMGGGNAEAMFVGFFDVLKPGGVLGVVEHRTLQDVPADDKSGYMSEAQVIAMATAAGFVLEEKSEVNANPADTRDHPNGVWTLPPSNRHEPADAEKYKAIGESDRMTLRLRKPAA